MLKDILDAFSYVEDDANDKRPRNFFWTLNNYTPEEEAYLKALPCTYMCFGYEICPTTGTPHLQGMTCFKDPLSWEAVKVRLGTQRVSVRKAYNVFGARVYCTKDGNFHEHGRMLKTKKQQGEDGAAFWAGQRDLAEQGRFRECHPRLYLTQYKHLEAAYHRFRDQFKFDYITHKNIWIWGASRLGKTRSVWEQYPLAFHKPLTKWWCNYNYDDVVVLEDIDCSHDKMLWYVKNWTDGKDFRGESKQQGARSMRPKLVVVTSNFHPSDIWLRERDSDPVIKRFDIYEFKENQPNQVVWPLPKQVDNRVTFEEWLAKKEAAKKAELEELASSNPPVVATINEEPESKRHQGPEVLEEAAAVVPQDDPEYVFENVDYLFDDLDERTSDDGSQYKD